MDECGELSGERVETTVEYSCPSSSKIASSGECSGRSFGSLFSIRTDIFKGSEPSEKSLWSLEEPPSGFLVVDSG